MAQLVKNQPAKQETQVRSRGQEDPLEKGMATHSSILAWEIPLTEEPGGLHSPKAHRESEMTWQLSNNKGADVQNRRTDVRRGREEAGGQDGDAHPATCEMAASGKQPRSAGSSAHPEDLRGWEEWGEGRFKRGGIYVHQRGGSLGCDQTLPHTVKQDFKTRPRSPHSQAHPSGSFHKPHILLHQRADRMKTTITEN